MANGAEGYGDFRSEHLSLQPRAKAQARNLQPASNVVFGDDGSREGADGNLREPPKVRLRDPQARSNMQPESKAGALIFGGRG